MAVCEKCWADASLRTISNGKSQYENYCDLLEERKDNPCTMDKQDKTAERGHWIGWLKKRIDLPDAQWQYVDFALRELQDHNESLQAKIKALEERLQFYADKNQNQ